MIRITVPTANERELRRFAALGRGLPGAEKKARSSAVRKMRTEGQRIIRETRRLKVGEAKDRIKPITLGGVPDGVEVDGAPIPIVAFRHRQTKQGITFYSHKSGPSKLTGAFTARVGAGHVGVFKRRGQERLPIDEKYTTGVAREHTSDPFCVARCKYPDPADYIDFVDIVERIDESAADNGCFSDDDAVYFSVDIATRETVE